MKHCSLKLYPTLTLCALGLISSHAAHAQTIVPYGYNGIDQNFTVPAGVTTLYVQLWGAGGGGDATYGTGGAGAYVSGDLSVTPNETLTVVVGGAGDTSGLGMGGYGGGGNGDTGNGGDGHGGGGRTALVLNGVDLVDAGGGGGAGGNFGYGGTGGDGGLTTGGDGVGTFGGGGFGGTQTSSGSNGQSSGTAGGQYYGGDGYNGASGGGGGGGYYGGGGGYYGGGGGGSSFFANLTDFSGQAGSAGTPGGTSATNYMTGVGNGGDGPAGNGELVITYTAASVPEPGSIALLLSPCLAGAALLLKRRNRR
jgi:hypothetical protein